MSITSTRFSQRVFSAISSALLLLSAAGALLFVPSTAAMQLQNRQLKIANAQANTQTTYSFSLQTLNPSTVGSIRFQFCSNDPLVGEACTAPTGFDDRAAVLTTETGMTGFVVDPMTTANELVISRAPAASPAGVSSYSFDHILNPDTNGSYYVRVETFASSDASGAHTDYGGLAFNIHGGLSIHSVVPPFLLFCIGQTIDAYDCGTAEGAYTDFGELSPTRTATGHTTMLVATNAEFGYTVRADGTTLTSGINTISPMASPDVSRQGTNQFGLNLRANSTPSSGVDPSGPGTGTPAASYNIPNLFKFVSGEVLASNTAPENYRMFTVDYIVNVIKGQAPGVYVTTLTYIALASF